MMTANDEIVEVLEEVATRCDELSLANASAQNQYAIGRREAWEDAAKMLRDIASEKARE